MTEEGSVACTLSGNELQSRLAAIASVGAESLIRRGVDGDRHLLYFRHDPSTRRRLEGVVAAEAECCSFLDLELSEQGGELILAVAAAANARPFADELAAAFAGTSQYGQDK